MKLDAIKAEAARISFIADHYDADSPSQMAANTFAKFILRAMPILEAADAWCDAQCDGNYRICLETVNEHDENCVVSKAEHELYESIVQFTEEDPT